MRSPICLIPLWALSLLTACSHSSLEPAAAGASGSSMTADHDAQTRMTTGPVQQPAAAGQPALESAGANASAAGRPGAKPAGETSPSAAGSGGSPAGRLAGGSGGRATSAADGVSGSAGAPASGGQPGMSSPPTAASPSKIYVSIYADSEITLIDGATDAITDHIPVGRGPAIMLETPDHAKLYTANWAENSVSGVNLATREVHTIKEDGQPFIIAMSPDGKLLYAGLTSNKIDVISTDTDTIARSMPMSQFPMSVIVSPDGKTLYVAFSGGTAEAIDAQTGAVVHPAISVGAIPGWISLTPDGTRAYTLNWGSGDVSVIDTMSWQRSATIKVGSDPIIGAVTPDNTLLCVTNFGTANAVIIDTKTNKILHTLMFDGRPTGVSFSPDGQLGYVADNGPLSLDSDANSLILISTSGRLPSNPGPGHVTVFSSSSGDKVKEISVGQWPSSVVIQPR